jgi:Asp-tRNA(Asn)/Glu-tRNA(Gln) amidotransferase B subunit
MGRKRKNNIIPKVHPELEGLDLSINEFGEMSSNIDIDKINAFLTKTVPDKKLINRSDDKYQQEFKALGLGGEDDEELEEYIEETIEEEEESPDILFKDAEEEEEIPEPPKKPKKKK